MKRFIVFDRQLQPLFDLDGRITEAMRYERINGEHKLDVKTTQPLEEGLRILVRDGTLKWREWVVDEPDEHKQDYDIVEGSYGCTWSVQYDLSTVSGGELWPGTYTPITAGAALAMVLAVQSRWEVGRVTVTGTAGTSLFDGSVWDYLGKLVEVWGGEMEPRIVVDSSLGVTHRYVDWLAHVGSETATRRFDYGEDCTRIRRRPKPGPRYCGIRPRGGSTATDQDGVDYSNRVGIEEEPSCEGHDLGSPYLYDLAAKDDFKRPDGHGGYEYPTLTVTYDSEDPEEILGLAQVDLHTYTRPEVSYEADVLQFAAAGMDAHGVALGDYVHVVDRKFGVAPLRLEARVMKVRVSMLDESDIKLTIGSFNRLEETIGELVRATTQGIERRIGTIEAGGTIVYLNELLQQLNDELNVLGGHTYIVDGYGLISYDIAVDDPLIGYNSSTGTWASHVTQIMGGGIRIANSKKPSFSGINDWNWRTLIVSGHIASELVTAVQITAGFIGNANGSFFLDLENDALSIGNSAQIGGRTVTSTLSKLDTADSNATQALSDASNAAKVATNYLTFNQTNGLDVGYNGTSAKTRVNGSGVTIYDEGGNDAFNAATGAVRVGRTGSNARVMVSTSDIKQYINNVIRFVLDSTGLDLRDSSGTSTAKFGTTTRIGYAADYHAVLNDDSFELVDDDGKTVFSVGFVQVAGSGSLAVVTSAMLFGLGLLTASDWQTVLGKYNVKDSSSKYALIVGGGSSSSRKNIFTLDWNGSLNTGRSTRFESTNMYSAASVTGNTNLLFIDDSSEDYGAISPRVTGGGSVWSSSTKYGMRFTGGKSGSRNYIDILTSMDGTKYYELGSPEAFRNALGMVSTSTTAGWEDNADNSGSIGIVYFTKTSFTMRKIFGRFCQFYLSGKAGVDVSSGGSLTLGTLPAGYRPTLQIGVDAHSLTRRATIGTGGAVTIQTSAAISNGATITVSGVFISAS